MVKKSQAGGDPRVVIRGVKGFLSGAECTLRVGEVVVIGRSRSADLSTRKAERLRKRTDWEDVIHSDPFLSVSRHHVRIHFLHKDLVEVKDISSNGTFLDGRRIDCVALTDLHRAKHVLALGAQERLTIEMVGNGR